MSLAPAGRPLSPGWDELDRPPWARVLPSPHGGGFAPGGLVWLPGAG
ncbi:MAG: hypothetical protein KIT52_05435 [Anaerolineae bacterium]|nr:hypothetical protein [Anaerolineae bacterium]